ncbi:MAG: ATP-binding protein [Thermodesulfobacteriota bacterium]
MDQSVIQFTPKLIGDLLNIIHNGILVVNHKNKIIFCNTRAAKLLHTTVGEIQDRSVHRIFMDDDREILFNNILHVIRTEQEYNGEVMLRRHDGSSFLSKLGGSRFLWGEGQEGIAFTIHDITQMKQVEYSLKHSERTIFLGGLADDLSHQIRNPVMVIGGLARRLQHGSGDKARVRTIINEAQRLESLLDTLNGFIELRRPRPVKINFAEMTSLAEEKLQVIVNRYGGTLVCSHDKELAGDSLLIDEELFVSALEAITANGIEAYDGSPADKVIRFETHHSASASRPFLVKIIDNGKGIDQALLPKVFDHFYSNKTGHMGMGLTFARRILEEQMGQVTIDSDLDKGTTVTCHLVRERRRPIRTALMS